MVGTRMPVEQAVEEQPGGGWLAVLPCLSPTYITTADMQLEDLPTAPEKSEGMPRSRYLRT